MSQSRQLAAIMFTDIVGYTSLMGDDEQNAFELLRKNRQLQKPLIEQFNGTWIKELGDGVLSSFTTVTDAVICATEIQKACTAIDDLKLRIGIHLGEVVFQDNDVFGDGVNIAARLQALAPIGGIWVSESVHNNVANKKEIKCRFIKEELLKNVKEPVRIYEVDVVVTQTAQPKDSSTIQEFSLNPSGQSIAILPFVDMSIAHDQEYLGDGIADEIIIAIAKIKELKVSSRSSSFSFKNHYEDVRIIGKKLGVSNILEGSIKKSGERLRISVQLINVNDGFQLWSDIFQMDVGDIFIIQENIAQSVVENLKLKFSPSNDQKLMDIGTENPEAYDLYLKGRFFWYKRYKVGLQLSLSYFEKAIEKDANFAKPYAGIADVYYLFGVYGLVKSEKVWEKSSLALKKAFELKPVFAEALISKAMFEGWFALNWSISLELMRQAINLNSSDVESRAWLAAGLAVLHSPKDEIIREIMLVLQTAPKAFFAHCICGFAYGNLGEFKKANDLFKNVLRQEPENVLAWYYNGIVCWQLKDFIQAEECLEKAVTLSGRFTLTVSILCAFYGYTGMDKKCIELLEELENRNKTEFISHGVFAVAYNGANRKNEAYNHLELGYIEKEPSTHFLLSIPLWSNIHNEERFKKLFETYMPISWEIYYQSWGRNIV